MPLQEETFESRRKAAEANPIAHLTPPQQQAARQQVQALYDSGKLNPIQRQGALKFLQQTNPQLARSPMSLSTGLKKSDMAKYFVKEAAGGVADIGLGLAKSFSPFAESEREKKIRGVVGYGGLVASRFGKAAAENARTLWEGYSPYVGGHFKVPEAAQALYDIYKTGPQGMGAAATQYPRFAGQTAATIATPKIPYVDEALPSFKMASRGFEHVERIMGDAPVDLSGVYEAAKSAMDRIGLTGEAMPPMLRKFVEHADRPLVPVPGRGPGGATTLEPPAYIDQPEGTQATIGGSARGKTMPFRDARNFLESMNYYIYQQKKLGMRGMLGLEQKMPGEIRAKLQTFADKLSDRLTDTTAEHGLERIYVAARREHQRAINFLDRAQQAGKVGVGATIGILAHEAHLPYYAPYLLGGYGFASKFGKYGEEAGRGIAAKIATRKPGPGRTLPGEVTPLGRIARQVNRRGMPIAAGLGGPGRTRQEALRQSAEDLQRRTIQRARPPGADVNLSWPPPAPGQQRAPEPGRTQAPPQGAPNAVEQKVRSLGFPEARVVQMSPADVGRIVDKAAYDSRIEPRLLRAMMGQESGGNAEAISPKDAIGDMQLEPATARELGVRNPLDPKENIPGGARYMRQMLDRYGGRVMIALAAYNAGPGAVDKYGGIPPIRETQDYVTQVLRRYQASGSGGGAP